MHVLVPEFMNHGANQSHSIARLTTARSALKIAHCHSMLSTIIRGSASVSKAYANLTRGRKPLHG